MGNPMLNHHVTGSRKPNKIDRLIASIPRDEPYRMKDKL
jgi:hypothetical protein